MNFREGLNYIYKNHSSDLELTDPFVLYCRLSDLCSSSYEDKHKVVLFYQIDKKIKVVQSIINNDFDVANKYLEVADLLSEESFNGLINTVKKVLDSNYIEKEKTQQKESSPKPVIQKAVVQKTEEKQEEETRTPLTSSYVGGGDTHVIIGLSIMGGILLAIVLLIVFACVFNWPWSVWQWLIGIVGGIILSAILIVIVAWFNEEVLCDYYVLGTIVLGVCMLINFILLLIFRDNYKVIFGWFSGFELLAGIILAFITFDDIEEGWGAIQIVEVAITIILFIIAMIYF